MSTDPPALYGRRLLIVMDSRAAWFSAQKRALLYRPFFESRPDLTVSYMDRRPRPVQDGRQGLARRIVRRLSRVVGRFAAAPHAPTDTLIDDQIVEAARDYDIVYVIKVPSRELVERLVALGRPRVVLDLNDALWMPAFRRAGWAELEEMLRVAHGVLCDNEYTAARLRAHNPRVLLVPDSPQVDDFDRLRPEVTRGTGGVRLGWIGSAENACSLYRLWEVLDRLAERHPEVHLRVLGANLPQLPRFEKVSFSVVPTYDQEVMIREALAMDIGLFPLFHVEESLARGAAKAMIYMAAGAAVVCEGIGENRRLVRDGVNGLLASTPSEWEDGLEMLVRDAAARQRLGAAGLAQMRGEYSARACFERLLHALEELSAPARP